MNKKVLLIGFISLFSCAAVFASQNLNAGYVIKDGYSDFTTSNAVDSIDFSFLNDAEEKILGKIFSSEMPDLRLSRIETKIFGAIQSGSYSKRINMIKQYSNRYLISNAPAAGFVHNSFGGLRRRPFMYRNGYLTGFTPPVNYNPNYAYNPYLVNNNGVFTRIRRVFNPNYANYNGFGVYNPYNTRNLNNFNNSRFMPIFGSQSNGLNDSNYYNGFGYDSFGSSDAGVGVKIIH